MTKSRGINKPKAIWTDQQVEILRARYPNEKTQKIADDLGFSLGQTFGKAKRIGLEKTPEYLATADSGRLTKLTASGVVHRFPPGHVPANKGKKTPGFAPGRMRETQFTKGTTPHNTLPIGSYRHDKDGTLQRKINNDPGNNSVRWRGVHELVWVETNGPVPPKHIVVFKPGMRATVLEEITLDKVECISLAENMKRNTRHNYPPEINEVIHARAVLTRHINKRLKNERTENDR